MSERYIQPLRLLVQVAFMVFCIRLAFSFSSFFLGASAGSGQLARPDAIDAFQPLSAMFTVVSWVRGIGFETASPAAVVILAAAMILALLLRRSFCSWVCPVGTVSEWLWKSGFNRKNGLVLIPETVDRRLRLLKYLILLLLAGAAFICSPEDIRHYLGGSGRAAGDLVLYNFFRHPSWSIVAVPVLILLSSRMRNPFCRYLCPYGALLSLAAIISPVAVQRNRNRCVSCGVCSTVCPSRIDVAGSYRVNDPECIGCCRCVSHCRVHSALSISAFRRFALPGVVYATLILIVFLGVIQLGKKAGYWKNRIPPMEYGIPGR